MGCTLLLVSAGHTPEQCCVIAGSASCLWFLPDAVLCGDLAQTKRPHFQILEVHRYLSYTCALYPRLTILLVHDLLCRLNSPVMLTALIQAREVVAHFKHSAEATAQLNEVAASVKVKPRALKQDVASRWSSTYALCIAIKHMKLPLQARY